VDDPKLLGAGKHRFPLQEKCGWDDDDTFLDNNQYTQICRNGIVINDTLLHEKHQNPRSGFNTRIPVLVSSTIFIDYDNNHPDAPYLNDLLELTFVKMNGRPKLPTQLKRLLWSCIDETTKTFIKIVQDAVSKKANEKAAAKKKAEEEATAKKKAEEEAAAKKRVEEEEEHKDELIDSDNDGHYSDVPNGELWPSDNETEEDEDDDEDEDEDEDEDDSNEKEEVKIDEPNKKKLGPGEQTRQTKRNVKLTFENEIPKRIKEIEDEEERKEYEADISELIYEMMMDKCDRHGNRQQFVVKRFRNTPWKELLPDLWEYCYNNKLDDEYVTGGSRLYKFMNK
jgi:cobalamin biosynthesis protein CobT